MRPSGLPVLKLKESAKAGVATKIAAINTARELTLGRLFIIPPSRIIEILVLIEMGRDRPYVPLWVSGTVYANARYHKPIRTQNGLATG
jgi:hypothetical protein